MSRATLEKRLLIKQSNALGGKKATIVGEGIEPGTFLSRENGTI